MWTKKRSGIWTGLTRFTRLGKTLGAHFILARSRAGLQCSAQFAKVCIAVTDPQKYRPDIDGLRAIAVTSVLFFHARLGFSGGFVGVDVFFVISGYLITGLILKDLDRGDFQLIEFWVRRIRRIFPALLVVVLTTLVAGWLLLFPVNFVELCRSIFNLLLLTANFYFWKHTAYFGPGADTMPLLHTWSLALEEQFYLFFPLLLVALKRTSRGIMIATLSIIGLVSFGISVANSYYYPLMGFFLLPARAWELLIGAIPALLKPPAALPPRLKEIVSWAGLLSVLFAIFFYDHTTRFPGLAALPPCAGTALIIWLNTGALTSTGKVLALRPLVFIGLISYSLYLWHWPILAFSNYWTIDPLTPLHRSLLLAASIPLAIVTWRWVEIPFRRKQIFPSRVQILSFAGIAALCLTLGGPAYVTWQGRWFGSHYSPQIVRFVTSDVDQGIRIDLTLDDACNGRFIQLGKGNPQVVTTAPKQTPDVFVWGDSHAMAVLQTMDTLCQEHGMTGLAATHSSTPPLLGFESRRSNLANNCLAYNDAVLSYIQKNHPPHVVLVAMWGNYRDAMPQFHDALKQTLTALAAEGSKVWILRQVPHPPTDVPRFMAHIQILGQLGPAGDFLSTEVYRNDAIFEDQFFRDIPASLATILDPSPFFLNAQDKLIVDDQGQPLFFDDSHVTTLGANRMRPLLQPIFSK